MKVRSPLRLHRHAEDVRLSRANKGIDAAWHLPLIGTARRLPSKRSASSKLGQLIVLALNPKGGTTVGDHIHAQELVRA